MGKYEKEPDRKQWWKLRPFSDTNRYRKSEEWLEEIKYIIKR